MKSAERLSPNLSVRQSSLAKPRMKAKKALALASMFAAAGLTSRSAQAANVNHVLSGTSNNVTAATFTPSLTSGGVVGDTIQYSTASTYILTLNVDTTIGGVKVSSGAPLTITGGNLTLDATGLTSGNQLFSNAGVAFLGTFGGAVGTSLTVNSAISMASDLDIGIQNGGSPSSVIIGGNITATGATKNLTFRAQDVGGVTVSGAIGTTGSDIAISNLSNRASNGTTLSGNLGLSVTSVTQNTVFSQLTLSGNNSAFAGTIALQAGTLNLNSANALGATGAGGTFTITGGNLSNSNGGVTLLSTNAEAWNGDFGYVNTGANNLNLGTGNVTLSATRTINAAGAGSLTVGGIISGSGFGITKTGAISGALILTGASTAANSGYTGTTTISAGTLQVSGASGSIAASSNTVLTGTGTLTTGATGGKLILDNTAGNTDRLNNTGSVSISTGADVNLIGNATINTTETIGNLTLNTGVGTVTVTNGTTARITTLAAGGFVRGSNFATGLIRGTFLGASQGANPNYGAVTLASLTGLTQVGSMTSSSGVSTGSVGNLTIVPYLLGDSSIAGAGSNFVTYDTTSGFRTLGTSEQSTISSVLAADINAKITNATVTLTAGAKVFNSLAANVGGSSTSSTVNGAGGASDTLTLTSGALANVGGANANSDFTIGGFSKIIFGGTSANGVTVNEAIISQATSSSGMETFIRSGVDTASAGGGLTKWGVGTVFLEAANFYTGVTTINQGALQIGSVSSGRATGTLAAASGAVTINVGTTLVLDQTSGTDFTNAVLNTGTFNITNNGTQTLSGNISGSGVGNFDDVLAGKTLNISGTNTYTDATTIAGTLNLTGSLSGTAISTSGVGLISESSTGRIGGTSALTVAGTGVSVLAGNNTYSGATTVTGTLQAVANSTNTVASASTALSANSALSLGNGSTLNLRADADTTFAPTGVTANSGTTTIDVNVASSGANHTLRLDAPFSAVGSSTNTTPSVLNVTGGNGYTLALGAVSLGANNFHSFNITTADLTVDSISQAASDSRLQLTGTGNFTNLGGTTRAVTKTITYYAQGTGIYSFNGAANAPGSGQVLINANSGTVVLNNNTATNGLNLGGGILIGSASSGATRAASSTDVNVLLGGTNASATQVGNNGGITFATNFAADDLDTGNLSIGGQNISGTNTFSGIITLGVTAGSGKNLNLVAASGGQVDFTNNIVKSATGTTGGLFINKSYVVNGATVTPTGTIRLAGANTFVGPTTITGGTLFADSAQALNTTAAGGNVTFTGGTLKYGSTFNAGANGDISTRIKNSTSDIKLDTNGLARTYAGVVNATNSGGLTLNDTAVTAGNLTLSGNNTYTGNTTVARGTLLLSGSFTNNISTSSQIIVGDTSAHSSANLNVNGLTGSTIVLGAGQTLSGYGSVTGTVKTSGNTTIISPGGSPGNLTLDNLDASSGARLKFEIGATDAVNVSDHLLITGALTGTVAAGGLVLDIDAWGFGATGPQTNVTYTLVDFTSSSNLQEGALVDYFSTIVGSGLMLSTSFGGSDGVFYDATNQQIQIQFSAVPEPTSLSLLGLGVGGLLARRKRRRTANVA